MRKEAEMKPVMLATDGSPTAAKATQTAIELAHLLDTELVIVSVWDIPYGTVGLAPMPVTGELALAGKEEAEKAAGEAASRAEEAGVEYRTVVLRGSAVGEICAAAETFGARILVIGSHGWGALKRAVFGSVSTGVLHHASCPVLVVPIEHLDGKAVEKVQEEIRA
jgi:nucleotide-binding universal stress UspA family protein